MKNEAISQALQTARTLQAQYGEDAEVIATMRAAEVAAMGDAKALAHWDIVIDILETGPSEDQLN